MQLEFTKAGALHSQAGDIGPISSSKGASELSFRNITKELAKKTEPVKALLLTDINDSKPVIISFPEVNTQRIAYIIVANFSKFPNENRNYDRTEYYVGSNELGTWLDYFLNKYKTEPVCEKNYEENPITINELKSSSKSIDSIVTAFAKGGEIIKLSLNDSMEILGSLPSIYHQFISFAINGNEQICKQLNIQISIGDNSNTLSTSTNLDLNNDTLLRFLDEFVNFKPCKSLSELAKLHIDLAKEYSDVEFNLQNKPNLFELFENGIDKKIKENLLTKLIDIESFGSNYSILCNKNSEIEKSEVIKKILEDFENDFNFEIDKQINRSNKANDANSLRAKLIKELGFNENSTKNVVKVYQRLSLLIALAVVNEKIGVNKKHISELLSILKEADSNLLDHNLLTETIEGLEKLEILKVKSSQSKKKGNKLVLGKNSHFNYLDHYASTLLNHKPSVEIFHLFLYLFTVPTALKLLDNISNENLNKYKNEIVNWLSTNDSELQTYQLDYEKLKVNNAYSFYFNSEVKKQAEANRKSIENDEFILELEESIQICDNKFLIYRLNSDLYENVLDYLNKPENIEKLSQNENLKYNIELGNAFNKYFDKYQTTNTSLFKFIDNKYPKEKNKLINKMKNFNNFSKVSKIAMSLGFIFFILGTVALFIKLNSSSAGVNSPAVNSTDIDVAFKDSVVYSLKQIDSTSFKFAKADQTVNLITFCTDSAINNLLKNNFNKLQIGDSTKSQIFFSFKNPNKFLLFFKDLNSKYLKNYLEFEKATSWKVKLAEGKPSIYYGRDYVNDMKTISVIMEP